MHFAIYFMLKYLNFYGKTYSPTPVMLINIKYVVIKIVLSFDCNQLYVF